MEGSKPGNSGDRPRTEGQGELRRRIGELEDEAIRQQAEIGAQRDEIVRQRAEIAAQRDEIGAQNGRLSELERFASEMSQWSQWAAQHGKFVAVPVAFGPPRPGPSAPHTRSGGWPDTVDPGAERTAAAGTPVAAPGPGAAHPSVAEPAAAAANLSVAEPAAPAATPFLAEPRPAAAPEPGTLPSAQSAPRAPRPALWVPNEPYAHRRPEGQPLFADLRTRVAAFRDLETQLTGRALAWAGAAAIVLGSVFFLSLAFSRGWIGPEGRVAIGLVGGVAFLVLAAWLFERRRVETVAVASTAIGLGVASVALYAGTRLYGLFPPELALAGSFVLALGAAAMAVRFNSQGVAALGLAAIAGAPPILGAGANLVTMAFLGVTLGGVTVAALARHWRALPWIGFVLTAPQLMFWVFGHPSAPLVAVAVLAYWTLHALSASTDEFTVRQPKPAEWAAGLLISDSLLALIALFAGLEREPQQVQAAAVFALAVGHFAFGLHFAYRRDDRYHWGLLFTTGGVGAVALAIPLFFDGPAVAFWWAIGAAVLASVAGYRRHVPALVGAGVVGALAAVHLLTFEYPFDRWYPAGTAAIGATGVPFTNPSGQTLLALLVIGAVAGLLVRRNDVRCALAAAGLVVVTWVLPFEFTGNALLAGFAAMIPVSIAADGLLLRLPGVTAEQRSFVRVPLSQRTKLTPHDLPLVGFAVAAVLAASHFLSYDLAVDAVGSVVVPAVPFSDAQALSGALMVAAFLAAAVMTLRPEFRAGLVIAAAAAAAYTALFELAPPYVVVTWCAIGVAIAAWTWRAQFGTQGYLAAAACFVAAAAALTIVAVVPLERLGVQTGTVTTGFWFVVEAIVAAGAVAATLALAARWAPLGEFGRVGLGVAAGVSVVYLLSAILVSFFQAQIPGSTPVEEVQKQAQVAVSILWAIVGLGVFAAGTARWWTEVREFGLALLALATAKVFLFDLSYLDVAYRVLSFVGLGLLLLLGAYVYLQLRPKPGSAHPRGDELAPDSQQVGPTGSRPAG